MDKIKPILTGLAKYHFWVVLGIVVVMALFTWNSGVGRLDEEFTRNKGQIESQFSNVNRQNDHKIELPGGPAFANQTWAEQTKQRTENLAEIVERAWQAIYDRQQEARTWPGVLGEPFVAAIQRAAPEQALTPDMTELYKPVLEAQVQRLPELVSASKIPDFDPRRPRTAAGEPDMMEFTGGVIWDPENYHGIKQRLSPPDNLTVGWVRQTQEDIWVYEMLLRAIDRANGEKGTRDEFNLPISRLDTIDIGLEISPLFFQRTVDAQADPQLERAMREEMVAQPAPARGRQARGAEEDETEKPKEPGRYLHEPQTVGFKPLPVRMRLRMNVDRLPQLMVELANAGLTTEVAEVFISHDPNRAGGESVGGGGLRPNQPRPRQEFGGEYGGPVYGGAADSGGITMPNQTLVELWAIVHVAQRPDRNLLLSSGDDSEENGEENED